MQADRAPTPSFGESPFGGSARRVPRPHGVTFIELIALTLVLLILAMIGIPKISPIVQQFRLKGAAWQLAGDLRLARQRAVTTQRRFLPYLPEPPSNAHIAMRRGLAVLARCLL